jgi:hypothetical protein
VAVSERIESFAGLVTALTDDGVGFRSDPARERVEIPVRLGSREAPLYLEWQQESRILQLVLGLPVEIPAQRVPAVAAAIARLNHGLAVPGFGVNDDVRFSYYRLTTLLDDEGGVTRGTVRRACLIAANTVREYGPLLVGVALERDGADAALEAALGGAPPPDRPPPDGASGAATRGTPG